MEFLLHTILAVDSDPKLAGNIAIAIMIALVIVCSGWIILKKVFLARQYRADEQFVKEYREKVKKQEELEEQKEKKPETILEDF